MKTLHQLSKKYRSQLESMGKLKNQLDQLRQKEQDYQDDINNLHKEIEFTKLVIDYCILTGETPAEAILKNTKEQIQSKIWQTHGFQASSTNTFNITNSSTAWTSLSPITIGSSHISNTGCITIGSPTATVYLGPKGISGSNGVPGV